MTGRLNGKVALVTGAARGQGESEARIFAREGARVVLADVLDELGTKVANDIGDMASYVHLDVTSEDQWAAAIAHTTNRFGRLDVLVNNAGIARSAPLASTTLADYRTVIDVNQVGVFLGMRAVIEPMSDVGRGSIVNISSIDGIVGMTGLIAYVASKFAVRGMTKAAALELGPLGIRVNSVHPGLIETPMLHLGGPAVDEGIKRMVQHFPLRRVGLPEDVAGVALFLASDDSAYCTGAEIVVDGGLIAGMPGPA